MIASRSEIALKIGFSENRAVYEVMWEKYSRTTYGTFALHAILEYRHTLRIRNTCCFSTTTMVA
jgi:predicted trehalose synthase